MLEEDYLSLQKHNVETPFMASHNKDAINNVNAIGSQIIRQIVIPTLTKEVNEGRNFAPLRQVFYSLILATWYKKKIKDSILNKVYSNQNKIGGLNVSEDDKDKIYKQYLRAFKKGVFNYIKETDTPEGVSVPRKYFSGGVVGAYDDKAIVAVLPGQIKNSSVKNLKILELDVNFAMNAPVVPKYIIRNARGQSLQEVILENLDFFRHNRPDLWVWHHDGKMFNNDGKESPLEKIISAMQLRDLAQDGMVNHKFWHLYNLSEEQLSRLNAMVDSSNDKLKEEWDIAVSKLTGDFTKLTLEGFIESLSAPKYEWVNFLSILREYPTAEYDLWKETQKKKVDVNTLENLKRSVSVAEDLYLLTH